MGKFDHLVAIGVQLYKDGTRDFDSWSELMICEVGPKAKPFLDDIMKCTLMLVGVSPHDTLLKKNCWEFKSCRRQNGNERLPKEGRCPAFLETKLNGIHGGNNGGRACWVVPGTLCDSKIQSSYFHKFLVCRSCEFYQAVRNEEGLDFIPTHTLIKMLFRWNRQPPNKNQGLCYGG